MRPLLLYQVGGMNLVFLVLPVPESASGWQPDPRTKNTPYWTAGTRAAEQNAPTMLCATAIRLSRTAFEIICAG